MNVCTKGLRVGSAITILVIACAASTPASAHGCHEKTQLGEHGWHRHVAGTCRRFPSRARRPQSQAKIADDAVAAPDKSAPTATLDKTDAPIGSKKPAKRASPKHKNAEPVRPATRATPDADPQLEKPAAPPPAPKKKSASKLSNTERIATPQVQTPRKRRLKRAAPRRHARAKPTAPPPPELMARPLPPDCKGLGIGHIGAGNKRDPNSDKKALEFERDCYASYERLTRYNLQLLQQHVRRLLSSIDDSTGTPNSTGKAIRSALVGKTMALKTSFGTILIKFFADGRMEGKTGKAIALATGIATATGTWSVVKNQLCQRWQKLMAGRQICFSLRIEKDTVHWTRSNGQKGTARLTH